jgi:hypothetical protein
MILPIIQPFHDSALFGAMYVIESFFSQNPGKIFVHSLTLSELLSEIQFALLSQASYSELKTFAGMKTRSQEE